LRQLAGIPRFSRAHPRFCALFEGGPVAIAPAFVDALAQAITRAALQATPDPWLCRAGEMLFRLQRVSNEDGQVLSADAATIEAFAQTGGFGNVGRLMRAQGAELAPVKMDVLTRENADLYWLRDELFSFALDLTPGREGAAALARVLELWVRRLTHARVTIEPAARIDDGRWRWHVGLDVDATEMLNLLYRGEALADSQAQRIVALFRLRFDDPREALAEVGQRPVYLGLACRPDRTLKVKPQNLLANLPLARVDGRAGG